MAEQTSQHPSGERYVLYQYRACPFCAMVRRFLDARGVELPERDILQDPAAFRELLAGGGRGTVPCLKIEDGSGTRWMYESGDIIAYLDERLPGGA